MLQKIILVFCTFVLVLSERKGRFFSFNFEDQDIHVDLDFSIPFLSIPIKKTVDSFGVSELPTININPASLALGGAVVLGTTVLLPLLMKSYASQSGYSRYSRLLENTEFSTDALVTFANELMTNGGLRGCALKVACWTAQEHYADPLKITSLVHNKLLSTIVNSTALEDAMLSGRNGRDCTSYTPCPIQKHHMPALMENIGVLTKYYGLL